MNQMIGTLSFPRMRTLLFCGICILTLVVSSLASGANIEAEVPSHDFIVEEMNRFEEEAARFEKICMSKGGEAFDVTYGQDALSDSKSEGFNCQKRLGQLAETTKAIEEYTEKGGGQIVLDDSAGGCEKELRANKPISNIAQDASFGMGLGVALGLVTQGKANPDKAKKATSYLGKLWTRAVGSGETGSNFRSFFQVAEKFKKMRENKRALFTVIENRGKSSKKSEGTTITLFRDEDGVYKAAKEGSDIPAHMTSGKGGKPVVQVAASGEAGVPVTEMSKHSNVGLAIKDPIPEGRLKAAADENGFKMSKEGDDWVLRGAKGTECDGTAVRISSSARR